MDFIITVAGFLAMAYLVYYAGELTHIRWARRGVDKPTSDRLEHEKRMMARRRNQYK